MSVTLRSHYFLAQSEKAHKNESKGKNFLYMRISEGMHLFTSYKNSFTIWQFGYVTFRVAFDPVLCFMYRFDIRQVNKNSTKRRESVYLSSREVFQVRILRQRIRTFHRWCQNSKFLFVICRKTALFDFLDLDLCWEAKLRIFFLD